MSNAEQHHDKQDIPKMVITADCFNAFGWNDMRATYILYRSNINATNPHYNPLAYDIVKAELHRAIKELDLKGNVHYFFGIWLFLRELEDKEACARLAPPFLPAEQYVNPIPYEDPFNNPATRLKGVPPRFCPNCYNHGMVKRPVSWYNDTILFPEHVACSIECCRKYLQWKIQVDDSLRMNFASDPPRAGNPFLWKSNLLYRLASLPPMSHDTGWESFRSRKSLIEAEKFGLGKPRKPQFLKRTALPTSSPKEISDVTVKE